MTANADAAGRVIVVTGPPGAGKSTVSRLLADRLAPSVHLRSDDFWHFIRRGSVPPYLPEAQHQNEIVMDVLAGAAFRYAAGGYQVLLDGIIGPWFLGVFRAASAASAVALHYLVLRPDEQTALARAAGRGADALTDPAPIRGLYRQFAELGELEPHVLDNSLLTAAETTTALLPGLTAGRYLLLSPAGAAPG